MIALFLPFHTFVLSFSKFFPVSVALQSVFKEKCCFALKIRCHHVLQVKPSKKLFKEHKALSSSRGLNNGVHKKLPMLAQSWL